MLFKVIHLKMDINCFEKYDARHNQRVSNNNLMNTNNFEFASVNLWISHFKTNKIMG